MGGDRAPAFVVGRKSFRIMRTYSRGGDVRIYSEAEMRRILGTWFSDVSWRRVGLTVCVAVARKGA